MADTKKPAESATVSGKLSVQLAPAGESGDPSVHQILAELQSARSNGDDEAVKDLTKKLAGLGFE